MKKSDLKPITERKGVSKEKNELYVEVLSDMLNCKTVWTADGENKSEFDKFYSVLEKRFPNITAKAKKLTFGGGCFVYVIEGKNATKNIMLMSHHDVVDGGDGWDTEPFKAVEKDGYLFARGSIDTKTPLFAELMACEELLSEGYDFEGINLYIGSSNNEEVCGDGMVLATEYFKNNGIHFDTVLDEGGAITEGQIPGVKEKSAMVAVHEKSRHLFRCVAKKVENKGHGGFGGKADDTIARLMLFIDEVNKSKNKIYKGKFYPEVKETFKTHVPFMPFPMNFLFKNIDFFSPVLKKVMTSIPAAAAMLSTGVNFTSFNTTTSFGPQAKPDTAETTMFLRCVREDDLYNGLEKIKEIAKKYGVEIEEIERDYCKPTDYNGSSYKIVEKTVRSVFPDVIVSPFLLTAGTDARRFTDVADNIFRFAPIDLNKSQFKTFHGLNENIGVKNIGECVVFYKEIIKNFKGEN